MKKLKGLRKLLVGAGIGLASLLPVSSADAAGGTFTPAAG
jgi:hypothetical protein